MISTWRDFWLAAKPWRFTLKGRCLWDRYTQAFVDEMKAFARCVLEDTVSPVSGMDGLYPVLMAAAATKACKEGRPVKVSEVE